MSYTKYEPIVFENGTLISAGSVDLETGELTMPIYDGKAPINSTNLNHLEQGLVNLEAVVLEGAGVQVENSLESNSTTNAPSIHAVNEGINTLNGVELYDSDNQSLKDDISNYKEYMVEYKVASLGVKSTGRISTTNNKVILEGTYVYNDAMWNATALLNISGTTLSFEWMKYGNFAQLYDATMIVISRIVGYK